MTCSLICGDDECSLLIILKKGLKRQEYVYKRALKIAGSTSTSTSVLVISLVIDKIEVK